MDCLGIIIKFYMTKICTKCKIEKEISEFGNEKRSKDGLKSFCKNCINKSNREYKRKDLEKERRRQKEYDQEHKKERKEYNKKRYQEKRDKILEKNKKWREENKEHCKEQKSRYYQEHKEEVKDQGKKWRQENPEKEKERHIKYNQEHPGKIEKYRKEYNQKNRENYNKYLRERCKTDINYRLIKNLRRRLNHVLKDRQKVGSAVKDLGCTKEEFIKYIESLWLPGMSWDNYGSGPETWQIDHKDALCLFDLEDMAQFLKACHYTNLQPMWHKDHAIKTKEDILKKKQKRKLYV
jgi:hypothetical protein